MTKRFRAVPWCGTRRVSLRLLLLFLRKRRSEVFGKRRRAQRHSLA